MSPTRVLGASAFCLAAFLALRESVGDEPPYHRLLQGEDAIKAAALEKEIEELQAQAKFAEAIPVARELAELRSRVQGGDHWEAADARRAVETLQTVARRPDADRQAFASLASLQSEAKKAAAVARYADAEKLHRRMLEIRRAALGQRHPDTAASYDNVAMNLNDQGKYAEAESLSLKALMIRRAVLGERHPDTAASYNSVAYNLNGQGKLAEAAPLYQKALEIRRAILGESHPDTAISYNNVAYNFHDQGKYSEAAPLYQNSLAIKHAVLGERHPSTARGYSNFAFILQEQGKLAEAAPLFQKALEINRAVLGERHPATALMYNNLAGDLQEQGKLAEAAPLFQKALAIRRDVLGEHHPDTAQSYHNVALNLTSQEKYAEAAPLNQKSLDIYRSILGERHPFTVRSLGNVAANFIAQGKLADAAPLLQQALDINRALLGERHPSSARSYRYLAINLNAQGKYAEASRVWIKAVESLEGARLLAAVRGIERATFHPDESPSSALAACLARQGQGEPAWKRLEQHLARGLLDDLSAAQLSPRAPADQARFTDLQRQLQAIERQLTAHLAQKDALDAGRARFQALTAQREALFDELVRLDAQRSRDAVYSRERIQAQIPPDAAFVAWVDLRGQPHAVDPNGEHWACILRRTGLPTWVKLPGSGPKHGWTKDDEKLPERLRQAILLPTGEQAELLAKLAAQRIAPIEGALQATADLPAVKHLIVAPAGWMAGIPIDVLTDRYTVSYAPSGTIFAKLREKHRPLADPRLLALGDPAFQTPASRPPPVPPDHGLLLTVVVPGGSAAQEGLRPGDVLLRYDGKELQKQEDLQVRAKGSPVPVQIWRNGDTFEKRVPAGKLSVGLDRDPAPVAIQKKQDFDRLLASTRGPDLTPLPATRYEVATLARLFPHADTLLGPDASELKLEALAASGQLSQYRVLHFATHGKMDPGIASRSALFLSRVGLPDPLEQARQGKKVFEGRLTVGDLAGWKLDADLVTLSACETALGPNGGGEGFLGFAQGLFLAGARSLVLSLWKVDDTATALLMTRFYANLLGKRPGLSAPMTKGEALAEAKRWLRNLSREEALRHAADLTRSVARGTEVDLKPVPAAKPGAKDDRPYRHPYYWAAFILLGDPE